jgi:X-Pro dipeptidyl-peptidase (S15 family)
MEFLSDLFRRSKSLKDLILHIGVITATQLCIQVSRHGTSANIDQRGTWRSEGNLVINCTLDGQDGYDLIEWIAQQSWSNGKYVLQTH